MNSRTLVPLCLVAAPFLFSQVLNASDSEGEAPSRLDVLLDGHRTFQAVRTETRARGSRYEAAEAAFVEVLKYLLDGARGDAKAVIDRLVVEGASKNLACELVGRALDSLNQRKKEADEAGLLRKVESIFDAKVGALSNTVISEVNRSAQNTAKRMGELVSEVQSLSAALTSLQNLSAQREKKLQALEARISCLEGVVVDAASCVKEQVVCNGEPRKGGVFVFRTEFEKERGSLQQRISCLEKFVVDVAGYIAKQQSEME